MAIVDKESFIGEYKLPKNCFSELDIYIEKFEKQYLLKLLGADLYALFIADLTPTTPQVPQTAKYLAIFNEFSIDDGSCLRYSEGIKKMLVQFIYFHFVRDLGISKTANGVVRDTAEASNIILSGYNSVQSYNQGVMNYNDIQWYICDNPVDYEERNLQPLSYISGI